MYHEMTYSQMARRRRHALIAVALVALLAIALVAAALASRAVALEQGASSVRSAVMAAATRCCAVEGSYPSSLAHLERDYGLVVNRGDYVVTYEWLGDNVPPSVTVVLR